MGNIRHWLEEAEKNTGETIEAIVVGMRYDDPDRYMRIQERPADENVILSRQDGLKKLDQEYDAGYGGAPGYPMYAWTPTRVYFISKHDDATSLNFVLRNPVANEPDFNGARL